MRTMRRGARLATGLTLLVALTITGCSGDGSDAANGTVEIDWWAWNPDDTQTDEIIALFNEEHPDIQVNARFIQFSDYVNTLRLALTSGEGPDVYGLQSGVIAAQFAPLSLDLTPQLEESFGAEWGDEFVAADQLNIDDAQIGLPWMVTGAGTIEANMTLLAEVGVDAVPTNLVELTAACEALADAGYGCLRQGASDAWQNIDLFQSIANQVDEGYVYDAFDGEVPFDSPEMVEALETYASLFEDGIIDEGAFGMTAYPDAADAFRQGEAGFITFGSWQNADMTQSRVDDFAEQYGDPAISDTEFLIAPFPSIVDPQGEAELMMFGAPDVSWAIDASTDQADAAFTFVEWLASSDASQGRIAATMQQPALASFEVDTSDVLVEEQAAAVEAQAPALGDMVGPRQIANADVEAALGDALAGVPNGTLTAEEAAASVQSAIDAATAE